MTRQPSIRVTPQPSPPPCLRDWWDREGMHLHKIVRDIEAILSKLKAIDNEFQLLNTKKMTYTRTELGNKFVKCNIRIDAITNNMMYHQSSQLPPVVTC